MKILAAKLLTEQEVLVGVPDDVMTETVNSRTYIVEPGSGVTGPKILLDPTVALSRGLLVKIEDANAPRKG